MHRARTVLLLGASFYSAWIIAPLLGSQLSPMRSYVSEIGATGQPSALLFRTTDILAGTCFVIAAVLAQRALRPRSRWPRVALGGVVLLGVATVCDALMPLSCTPTADAACAAREAAFDVPLTHLGHAVSSGIAGFGGVVAVLAWWLWRRRTGFDGARPLQLVGAGYLVTTVWTLAAMLAPALQLGLAQRLQIITLTVWLVLAAVSCREPRGSSVPE